MTPARTHRATVPPCPASVRSVVPHPLRENGPEGLDLLCNRVFHGKGIVTEPRGTLAVYAAKDDLDEVAAIVDKLLDKLLRSKV